MSILRLITRMLAAQAVETVKSQAAQAIFSTADATEKNGETEPDEKAAVDIGFVFAMPMEAAGIVDRLERKKTTCGNGRTFHTGLFGNSRVALVESGVGQEKATSATEVLIDVFAPERIVSAGYGGGLSKRLKRFNVCFPEMLIRLSDGARLDLAEPIPKFVEAEVGPVKGKLALLTADRVIDTPVEKFSLGRETGAELVDMESFAVAEVCRNRAVPFRAIRVVLDDAEEELPKDMQRILKHAEVGGARLAGSVLGSLFRRPTSLLDLFSLKQRALEAADRLANHIGREIVHDKNRKDCSLPEGFSGALR